METLFVGRSNLHLQSIDSTNSYASVMLRQIKPAEGTLIFTFKQQKGRGQRGNTWESKPNKNIALSLILYPSFLRAEKQFLLTKIASLAVADLMAELLHSAQLSSEVTIKWPNDIYIGDKKIAGILIENNLREQSLQSSIIGIGININQKTFTKKAKNATSLKLLTDTRFNLLNCLKRFCELIEARYLQLKGGKLEIIDIDYLNYLYRLGEWHDFSSENEIFKGKIIGISKSGKLRIELKSEEVKEFDLKEITFI